MLKKIFYVISTLLILLLIFIIYRMGHPGSYKPVEFKENVVVGEGCSFDYCFQCFDSSNTKDGITYGVMAPLGCNFQHFKYLSKGTNKCEKNSAGKCELKLSWQAGAYKLLTNLGKK
ncbi:MAG: hypothetical protein NTU97_03520 [Candidatus Magasanikbacteria bacterium]|nr:hypothetical protein [Candidatus Magasanikbacteria bacterium]